MLWENFLILVGRCVTITKICDPALVSGGRTPKNFFFTPTKNKQHGEGLKFRLVCSKSTPTLFV